MPVEPQMILRILAEAGLAVKDCLHIMDTDSIRHIIKNHGKQEEAMRGQIPLGREDFLLLPNIFGNPDIIEGGGKTKPGRDTIRYIKTVGGFRYHYAEELRTKKNRLAAVTFYKRKARTKRSSTPDASSLLRGERKPPAKTPKAF